MPRECLGRRSGSQNNRKMGFGSWVLLSATRAQQFLPSPQQAEHEHVNIESGKFNSQALKWLRQDRLGKRYKIDRL